MQGPHPQSPPPVYAINFKQTMLSLSLLSLVSSKPILKEPDPWPKHPLQRLRIEAVDSSPNTKPDSQSSPPRRVATIKDYIHVIWITVPVDS